MLQIQTVEPGTLSLLRKLMTQPELSSFRLVGGTALSLYYGHRRSVDLDLFSTDVFDTVVFSRYDAFHDNTKIAFLTKNMIATPVCMPNTL